MLFDVAALVTISGADPPFRWRAIEWMNYGVAYLVLGSAVAGIVVLGWRLWLNRKNPSPRSNWYCAWRHQQEDLEKFRHQRQDRENSEEERRLVKEGQW